MTEFWRRQFFWMRTIFKLKLRFVSYDIQVDDFKIEKNRLSSWYLHVHVYVN